MYYVLYRGMSDWHVATKAFETLHEAEKCVKEGEEVDRLTKNKYEYMIVKVVKRDKEEK